MLDVVVHEMLAIDKPVLYGSSRQQVAWEFERFCFSVNSFSVELS